MTRIIFLVIGTIALVAILIVLLDIVRLLGEQNTGVASVVAEGPLALWILVLTFCVFGVKALGLLDDIQTSLYHLALQQHRSAPGAPAPTLPTVRA